VDSLLDRINWEAVLDTVAEHGARILLVVVMAWLAVRIMNRVAPRIATSRIIVRPGADGAEARTRLLTVTSALTRTLTFVVVAVALLMILAELGLNLAPIIAGLSVGSIALGLAAQTLVRDYLRGIVILGEQQYSVGDRVTIADRTGVVEEITLRRTLIRADDGTLHFVSNSDVSVASRHPKVAFAPTALEVTVGYNADPERVAAIVNEALAAFAEDEEWAGALQGTPVAGGFEAFSESGATLSIRLDVRQDVRWVVVGELHRRVRRALAEADLDLPRDGGAPEPRAPSDG
jgi:small conductance mechanosensitive channel